VPEPCVLSPERVVEHQYVELLPEGLQEGIEEWEVLDGDQDHQWGDSENDQDEEPPMYGSDLSIAPGWKVGGFASWNVTGPGSMDCACGRAMEPLLAIDSSEWDGATRSWIPLEDQASAHADGASTPTEVVVGRGGTLHVFTCSDDPTHPHRLSIQ
jgi:hypothetical protein